VAVGRVARKHGLSNQRMHQTALPAKRRAPLVMRGR